MSTDDLITLFNVAGYTCIISIAVSIVSIIYKLLHWNDTNEPDITEWKWRD